jgi:hypothetical protein
MAKTQSDSAQATAAVPAEAASRPIRLDDRNAVCSYSNFCRVTGTPEEMIIDFGMNGQPMGGNDRPIEVKQRVVLNFYTAKRLLHALHVSVKRHEDAFGMLETDVQKRVLSQE